MLEAAQIGDPADENAAKVERLLEVIAPSAIEDNLFVIDVSAHVEDHLFGGLVAAQALHAAYTTVDRDRRAHSAHTYFLRRGRPELPIEFEVHRDTDGRSFSARRVVARQEGRSIFTMVCSFHVPEDTGRILASLPVDLSDPTSLPIELLHTLDGCFEVRHPPVDKPADVESGVPGLLWIHAAGPLPDDPMLHDCLLFYASDMGLPWHTVIPVHENTIVSLDHTIWLHGSTRMDEWHFLALEPVAVADARGFYTGRIWNQNGTHVASLAQENLIRPIAHLTQSQPRVLGLG